MALQVPPSEAAGAGGGGRASDPPAVVLLHGQPGSARDWDRVVAALGSSARLIVPDRPGWDPSTSPQGLAANAGAALALLDSADVEQAVFVGHSLGAAIAVWAALHQPQRVAALVLAAPAANRASLAPLDRWLSLPVVGPMTSGASLMGLGLALRTVPLRRRIARRAGLDEEYLQVSGRTLQTSWARRSFTVEQRALVWELPALEHKLAQVRVPTLIITGDRDEIVPAAAPRALAAQIPGARLIELPQAGHLLPQRHPSELAEAIRMALPAAADTG